MDTIRFISFTKRLFKIHAYFRLCSPLLLCSATLGLVIIFFGVRDGKSQGTASPDEEKKMIRVLLDQSKDTLSAAPLQALIYVDDAITLLEPSMDSSLLAEAYHLKGSVFRNLNEYEAAIPYFRLSASLSEKVRDYSTYANALNNLGILYDALGDYDEALANFLGSLNALNESDDPKGVVFAYNNIALIHMANDSYDKAWQNLQRSVVVAKKYELQDALTYPFHNLGDLYAEMGKFDSALYYYDQSYQIDHKLNDQQGVGINLRSMADVHAKQGMLGNARQFLEKALKIHQSASDKFQICATYISLSNLFLMQQQYAKAAEAAKSALSLARELGAKHEIQNASKALSQIYKETGSYEQALEFTELYHLYRDSLYNEAKSKEIALLQLKQSEAEKELLETDNRFKTAMVDDQQLLIEKQTYLVIFISFGLILSVVILAVLNNAFREKKIANHQLVQQKDEIENFIKKLKRLNEDIQKQKNNLEQSNKIKDKLISIISHDFRSPLNSLEGILYLMSEGQISDEEMKMVSRELRVKVNITTNLLDNLLNWAKNQMQGIKPMPEVFDVVKLVNETTRLLALQAENKGVIIENSVEFSEQIFADFEMTKLVLRNLVNNAIKFTSKGDSVIISTHKEADYLIVEVKDSGVGMEKNQLQSIFTDTAGSTLGTSHEKGTGLGLMLCKDFVEKNQGEIYVTSKAGEGSSFSFSIPLAQMTEFKSAKKKNELTFGS